MQWESRVCSDGSGGWIEANTAVGDWVIEPRGEGYAAWWTPVFGRGDDVLVGHFRSQRAAERGCMRYANLMAAKFAKVGGGE